VGLRLPTGRPSFSTQLLAAPLGASEPLHWQMARVFTAILLQRVALRRL
jgi:hypothetical protein